MAARVVIERVTQQSIGYFGPVASALVRTIERLMPLMTDRIIVIAEQQRLEIANRFRIAPSRKVSVVPLGLDLRPRVKVKIVEPLGYLEFLGLQREATVVVTDSGGIQEETTYLEVPCVTVRENTERPVTVTMGTNVLVGRDLGALRSAIDEVLNGRRKAGRVPPLWDGHASGRIADVLCGR